MKSKQWSVERFAKEFWNRVNKTETCWIWKGCRHTFGYGLVNFGGTMEGTHRVSWKLANGDIPEGMCILHKCDNPPCVNPDHLFLGTKADNIKDAAKKGRVPGCTARGVRNANSPFVDSQVEFIRQMKSEGFKGTELAKYFNVSHSTIYMMTNRRSWSHIA